jgi:hypothetical protein
MVKYSSDGEYFSVSLGETVQIFEGIGHGSVRFLMKSKVSHGVQKEIVCPC